MASLLRSSPMLRIVFLVTISTRCRTSAPTMVLNLFRIVESFILTRSAERSAVHPSSSDPTCTCQLAKPAGIVYWQKQNFELFAIIFFLFRLFRLVALFSQKRLKSVRFCFFSVQELTIIVTNLKWLIL